MASALLISFINRSLDLILFTSIFISGCAVIMVWQSYDLLEIESPHPDYLYFVFFSTLCSYNFHWFLTPADPVEQSRVTWTQQHKSLHLFFILVGILGSIFFGLRLLQHLPWLMVAALLTFLYSAPKISFPPFHYLRKIAVGKTIYLAFVWMYVTTALPLLVAGKNWVAVDWLFCASRFFLIYSICIIFDYRDRTGDRIAGIKSLITFFSEKGIDRLFYISLACFAASTLALFFYNFSYLTIIFLLLPGLITMLLYKPAKQSFSDYLYYFVLDGLMMFSAIFTAFLQHQRL